MKVKYEIERKIEDDNGKKSEKETTVTFDDIPDIKKAVKKVGAFFTKKVKEVTELATDVAAEITYNVAATVANALDTVAETADTVVNSIDRFIDDNYEVIEDEIDEEEAEEIEISAERMSDILEAIIEALDCEDNESDDDDTECDSEETSEDNSDDKPEAVDPVEIFIKGVIGDIGKISNDVIAFVKADDEEKSETLKKVEDYVLDVGEKIANLFGVKIKVSKEGENAQEDEIEKVSDDSSNADEPAEEVVPENPVEEKNAKIPEGEKFTLAEYLDYLEVYKCEDQTVNTEKEACIFFAAIGYPASYVSRVAFEQAATLEHINYNSVSEKVMEYVPKMSKDQIVEALKADFDKWLETREDVKMHCAKPTFRFLLKYFVKKIRLS